MARMVVFHLSPGCLMTSKSMAGVLDSTEPEKHSCLDSWVKGQSTGISQTLHYTHAQMSTLADWMWYHMTLLA